MRALCLDELQLEIDKEKQTRHSLKIRLKELRKNKGEIKNIMK